MKRLLIACACALLAAAAFFAFTSVESSVAYGGGPATLRVEVYNTCFSSDCSSALGYWRTHVPLGGATAFVVKEHRRAGAQPKDPDAMREGSRYVEESQRAVIAQEPDVAVMPEVLRGLHGEEIERAFREAGYGSAGFSCMSFFEPPFESCVFIAAKEPAQIEPLALTNGEYLGEGGAAVRAYFPSRNLSVIGVHLATIQGPQVRQTHLAELAAIVLHERSLGRKVVVAGDLNDDFEDMEEHVEFASLGLRSSELVTYPSWGVLGRISPLDIDHVLYAPGEFTPVAARTVRARSDHMALVVDLADAQQGASAAILYPGSQG